MKNKIRFISVFTILFLLIFSPFFAHAQTVSSNCVVTKVGNPPQNQPLPPQCNIGGAAPGCLPGSNDPEPPHDYSKTKINGKTVNVRTKVMLDNANRQAKSIGVPTPFIIAQGSYNPGGVSASGGTHDGGGAIDISVNNLSPTQRNNAVKALRMVGFAAWLRSPSQGPWPYHIHAVAIGDKELAGGAANQVKAYFAGRNGLSGGAKDTDPRPVPGWAAQYGACK